MHHVSISRNFAKNIWWNWTCFALTTNMDTIGIWTTDTGAYCAMSQLITLFNVFEIATCQIAIFLIIYSIPRYTCTVWWQDCDINWNCVVWDFELVCLQTCLLVQKSARNIHVMHAKYNKNCNFGIIIVLCLIC